MARYVSLIATATVASIATARIASLTPQEPGAADPSTGPHMATAVVARKPATSASAWPTTASPVHRIKEKGIPNFGQLNSCVWRSGQPTRDGYERLAALGLKTVVNLRSEFPQDKDLVPQGVRYVYIPVRDQYAPTDEQAKVFMDVVADPKNWPVLVHCQGGEGRAGVMSALVRHSFDGWTDAAVMREVGNFRIPYLGFIRMPMPGVQQRFIRHWEAATQPGGEACSIPAPKETRATVAQTATQTVPEPAKSR